VRYALDRSVRRFPGPPPALLGGAPRRWFRLTEAGDELLQRVGYGEEVGTGESPTAALVDRLVDAGVLHPRPEPGSVPASRATLVVPVRDRPEQLDALRLLAIDPLALLIAPRFIAMERIA
jgi:hypothetical protein